MLAGSPFEENNILPSTIFLIVFRSSVMFRFSSKLSQVAQTKVSCVGVIVSNRAAAFN